MKSFLLLAFMTGSIYAGNINLKTSSFEWKGSKVTGKHYGNLSLKSAYLRENESGKITAGEFVINMNSLTITDLKGEWAAKFLGHIKSADFFEVQKHPTAKLVVTSDDGTNLTGNLTIKGKTHPIKIPYTKSNQSYSGIMTFDRTKFDMKYGSGNFFKGLGDNMIHDKVTVNFNIRKK